MNYNELMTLDSGDWIVFDTRGERTPFDQLQVMDVDAQNIAITGTVAANFEDVDGTLYTMETTTGASSTEIETFNGDDEWTIFWDEMDVVEDPNS